MRLKKNDKKAKYEIERKDTENFFYVNNNLHILVIHKNGTEVVKRRMGWKKRTSIVIDVLSVTRKFNGGREGKEWVFLKTDKCTR